MSTGLVRRKFTPLPAQREFLEATEPEVMYSGAFGAGKSRVGCEKGVFLSQHYPGNVGLICRKVASDLPSTTLETLLAEVLPPDHVLDHHKTEHKITVRSNGRRPSVIYYRGLDRPAGIGSMTLGWVFVDEAIECDEEDWSMLEGRLRLNTVPFHQLFTATNPGHPEHWLHHRFFPEYHGAAVPLDAEGRRVRRVIETDAFQNKHNPRAYVERLRRLTGVHYERYALGKWVGFEGLVYSDYDPRVHQVDAFPIPQDWKRYRSIDFGTANPFVCLWAAEDPRDGQLVVYREWYMTGRTARAHATVLNELSKGEAYADTVADHDLGDRLELEAAGIRTTAAVKDVALGVQTVQERLKPIEGSGRPGLVFFRGALVEEDPVLVEGRRPACTAQEWGGYKWAKGAGGVTKDEPKKGHDHGLDAVRYLAVRVAGHGSKPFWYGSV